MNYDYDQFVEHIKPMANIVSVEVFPDGTYGNIRFVTANSTFLRETEETYQIVGSGAMLMPEYIPDQPYERYIPKDRNFEEFAYRSAILGETLHTYIQPDRMPVWMHLTAIPLKSDKPNVGYCAFLQRFTEKPDYDLMANISPDVSSNVLQICMKLRGASDFMTTITDVINDIRNLCDAEHCCILITDFSRRKCSVLCEALSIDTHLSSMEKYVNDDFFAVIDTWHGTIGGSTCAIIKDQKDWDDLKENNPVWYNSIKPAGAKNIVLFPLKYRGETLGFIWAISFDETQTMKIKEMLELTTYFLASELASYQLFQRLEILSSQDVLTGIYNRNAMNNRIDGLLADRSKYDTPVGIVFADLNGLKQVNDTEGHFSGDLLLKDAALTLQKYFPEYEIYRAGGDEFMVLALEADPDRFTQLTKRFQEATSTPDGVCFAVGCCYGTAEMIRKSMQTADQNMYLDKEAFYQKYPERRR